MHLEQNQRLLIQLLELQEYAQDNHLTLACDFLRDKISSLRQTIMIQESERKYTNWSTTKNVDWQMSAVDEKQPQG